MKRWWVPLSVLVACAAIYVYLRHLESVPPESSLHAKSSPRAASQIQTAKDSVASFPGGAEEALTPKLASASSESLSYPLKSDWVEDILYRDLAGDFSSLVKHQVFTKQGDPKPRYTSYHLADQIVLSMTQDLSESEILAIEEDYQVKLLKKLSLARTYQFQLSEPTLKRLVKTRQALEEHPGVEASEFNGIQFAALAPNDPYFQNNLMWGLRNDGKLRGQDGSPFQAGLDTAAPKLWDNHTDCSKVPVAVLDTGVDYSHPDLKDVVSMDESRNFTSQDPKDFGDSDRHGTHVAGTIGAVGNNGLGVTGVCWKAKILSIRVLGPQGGTNTGIAEGIVHFAKSSARVANMSLGSQSPPPQIYINAVKEVEKAGKLIIASAGNDSVNVDTNNRPIGNIASDNIIVVAAIDGNGKKASFSNFGVKNVDIAAPGVQIWSTVPKGNAGDYSKAYAAMGGTSMATPHVAGAVALIWSQSPSLDAKAIRAVFLDTAARRDNLKTLAPDGRILQIANVDSGLVPEGKISDMLKSIELRQSAEFEIPVSVLSKYTTIKSIEVVNGEVSLGMAEMNGEKIKVSIPGELDKLEIRLKITDADGRVTYSSPVMLDAGRSKSPTFDQIDLTNFLGDIPCQLKETVESKDPILHFDKKLVSPEFCQKVCRMLMPMVHSSRGKSIFSCGVAP